MGAFRYCENDTCQASMEKPTPYEDLVDGQTCPSCGKSHMNHFSLEEWIIDLWDELKELKDGS